ncbi:MAG: helix-turn-helix domain-containing protein [Acidobacteria bacterium]|nr:MAG: helix-turn-helix domain-containing protein [Acidobacteriota bacterium]
MTRRAFPAWDRYDPRFPARPGGKREGCRRAPGTPFPSRAFCERIGPDRRVDRQTRRSPPAISARKGGLVFAGSVRFGGYLRALRLARRLTLDDVERMTSGDPEPVTRSLLSRLENGKARVSLLKLLALARVYRVSVGVLADRLELAHAAERVRRAAAAAPRSELVDRARRAAEAGDLREALMLHERAMGPGPGAAVQARLSLARALLSARRPRLAKVILEELRLEELGPEDRARAVALLAAAAIGSGETLAAIGFARCLDDLPGPLPEDVELDKALVAAELATAQGDLARAGEAWMEAAGAAQRAGHPAEEIRCYVSLAALERRRGRWSEALFWARKALRTAGTSSEHRGRVAALIELGRVHASRGGTASARRAWAEARRSARELGLREELCEVYAELWRLAEREGDKASARACLRSLRHLARCVERLPAAAPELAARLGQPSRRHAG